MQPHGGGPDTVVVLGARGLEVEVAGALVAALQQVDEPERLAQIARAEAQVLVVLDAGLTVEVDVEELVRPHGLGDAVREVEPRHLLVSGLRVDADQLGALQALDEGQGVADGGQQDVAARLVRLGLDGEAEVVALLDDVLAQQVEGLLHPVEGQADVLRPAGLGPLAAAPRHEGARAQLDGEVDVAQRLAERVTAYATVVGGEPAVLEDGMGEEVRGHHGHDESAAVDRLPEALDDPFALGLRRPEGDQVVVVEGHPQAPSSASRFTDSTGSMAARVASPKGSLPCQPTVHRPKLNLSSGVGVKRSVIVVRPPSPAVGTPGRQPGTPICSVS